MAFTPASSIPSGGGGGGGVVQQGVRDVSAQAWYIDNAPADVLDVNIASPSPLIVGDGGGSLTVDGTVAATQGTSPWVVGDGGTPLAVTGPLTDAELRASPVPVTGTLAVTGVDVQTGNARALPVAQYDGGPVLPTRDPAILSLLERILLALEERAA